MATRKRQARKVTKAGTADGRSGARTGARAYGAGARLTCTDCGGTFRGAAALASHGRHAHGRPAAARAMGRGARTSSVPRITTVDGDALLRAVFPAGVPARDGVLRAVTAWLEDARRLAGMARVIGRRSAGR